MKIQFLYPLVLILALALGACSAQANPPGATQAPGDEPQTQPPAAEPTEAAYPLGQQGAVQLIGPAEAYPAPETAAEPAVPTGNCASVEANELGAAIAADYAFTNPEQVMEWFCAGAEFEDILVALETADQTGAIAEEMLAMLAAGATWEEIWQVVGLTGQP